MTGPRDRSDDKIEGGQGADPDRAAGASGTFVQTLKAVGSGLFGVRSAKGREIDMSSLNPIHVILAGVIAVAIFIGLLLFFARMMLRASGVA